MQRENHKIQQRGGRASAGVGERACEGVRAGEGDQQGGRSSHVCDVLGTVWILVQGAR